MISEEYIWKDISYIKSKIELLEKIYKDKNASKPEKVVVKKKENIRKRTIY